MKKNIDSVWAMLLCYTEFLKAKTTKPNKKEEIKYPPQKDKNIKKYN